MSQYSHILNLFSVYNVNYNKCNINQIKTNTTADSQK